MPLSLKYAVIALQFLAAAILLFRRLARPHAALVAYLVFIASVNALLVGVDLRSENYLRLWAFALPVGTVLSVAMGLQAYGRSLETSPQARRLSHRLLLALCCAAAILAQTAQETLTPFGVASRLDQGVSAALGLFCLAMLPILHTFYSQRRRPNAIAQEWILTAHYLGNAMMLLATHWRLFPWNTYLAAATATVCCLAWIFCLTPGAKRSLRRPPIPAERPSINRLPPVSSTLWRTKQSPPPAPSE